MMGDVVLMPLQVPTPERQAEMFAATDELYREREREIRNAVADLPWPRPRLRAAALDGKTINKGAGPLTQDEKANLVNNTVSVTGGSDTSC